MLLHQDGPDYFSAQKVWDFKKLNYASTASEVWGAAPAVKTLTFLWQDMNNHIKWTDQFRSRGVTR